MLRDIDAIMGNQLEKKNERLNANWACTVVYSGYVRYGTNEPLRVLGSGYKDSMKGVLNTMLNKQPMSMPCMGNINSTAAHMGCPKALGFRLSFFWESKK